MPLPTRTKVAIIGSGPAGYTAAIYAARANLEPVVFEGGGAAIEPFTIPGGQLMITTDVENYPGFPKGVEGPALMELFKAQAERLRHAPSSPPTSRRWSSSDRPFRVVSTEGELVAETLIIATGASAKWLGIPSEDKFQNYGVSACATCDGALVQGARAGGRRRRRHGDGGGDVPDPVRAQGHVIHRRDEFRASKIMLDRATPQPEDRAGHRTRSSTRSWASCRGRA